MGNLSGGWWRAFKHSWETYSRRARFGRAVKQVISDPQGVSYYRESWVHSRARREKASIDNVQVIKIMSVAVVKN